MADESAYVGAYWGPRAEPVETCAGRLHAYLTRLATLHPQLGQWHTTVDSPSEGAPPIQLDEDTLRAFLLRGRNRTDDGGQVIEELGYSQSLWNGREDDWEVGTTVTCGVTSSSLPNAVVFDPPFPTPANTELFRPLMIRGVIEAVVEAWAPQRAKFITNSLDEMQDGLPTPQVGWLTYVSAEIPGEPAPAGAVVRRFGDGHLIEIGDDPFAVDPAAAQRVREWLGVGIPRLPE